VYKGVDANCGGGGLKRNLEKREWTNPQFAKFWRVSYRQHYMSVMFYCWKLWTRSFIFGMNGRCTGASSESAVKVCISRSSGQGQGHRSKTRVCISCSRVHGVPWIERQFRLYIMLSRAYLCWVHVCTRPTLPGPVALLGPDLRPNRVFHWFW